MHLSHVDYAILIIYTLFVLGIGWALKRYMKSSTDFFLSGRAIPAWITGLAFISANLGAQEVIGMGASGAKYGMLTCHFYWLGAILAMIFVGIFMMPFYYGSKARSVPEFLKLRFDEKTRGFNAVSFAAMTVMSSGVSMYALAKLLELLLGWPMSFNLVVSAAIVLVYIFLGGLTSAIYNEVVQFFLIVLGFLPLVFLGLRDVGGWGGLVSRMNTVAQAHTPPYAPGTLTSVWRPLESAQANPMGVDLFGMVMGLGFVLAFAYWCTDFLVIQRAMAAESMSAARRTPLIAAFPKMLFPFLVIVPGMIAMTVGSRTYSATLPEARTAGAAFGEATAKFGNGLVPPKLKDLGKPLAEVSPEDRAYLVHDQRGELKEVERDRSGRPVLDYDMATPRMLAYYFPAGLLGLGLTALMASFMSGMAGNVTAFNTVWTYDIYQSYIAPNRSDTHYLWMGRAATVFGIAISLAAAYVASRFNNIMDLLQLVFGFVNAPLLATFLLGMFWRRATGHGAFCGLLSGTLAAAAHHGLTAPEGTQELVKGGWLAFGHPVHFYRSEMASNFWTAIWAFSICLTVTVVVSLATRRQKSDEELQGLVWSLTPHVAHDEHLSWYERPVTLALVVLAATIVLNVIFW
jgi:solute:Na+ symporter, SSS family